MANKRQPMYWMGHPIRDEGHGRDLDLKAATYQFHEGLSREKAEKRAIYEDRVERHQKAAAHHLEGIKAAHAVGNMEDAQRHHGMYSLHLKALGHDPAEAVPHEVARHRDAEDWKHVAGFKAHPDDQFLVQPVRKTEGDSDIVASQPSPLKMYEGGGEASAPKYGHLRVVKVEDVVHLVGLMVLAKGAHDKVKQFDVRRSFLRHKHLPEEKAWDYSAWLTPEQHQEGYKMFVLSHGPGNPVRVHVLRSQPGTKYQERVGGAYGNVRDDDLEVEKYHLAGAGHENKGIEGAMLNAMMGHARRHMGVSFLSHAPFTPEASAFIEAVARPHGLELGDVEDTEEAVDRPAYAPGPGVRAASPKRPRVPRWWATSWDD